MKIGVVHRNSYQGPCRFFSQVFHWMGFANLAAKNHFIMFDYHIHTKFSSDCNVDPVSLAIEADRMGLTEICITDHLDLMKYNNKIF